MNKEKYKEKTNSRCLWKPVKTNKEIKAFQLYDPVMYERGIREKETGIIDPNFDSHFINEAYHMFIFPTGFKDLYHVVIESCFEEHEYFTMHGAEIYARYHIHIEELKNN